MGLLLYKSTEMFSATELIRKSKTIFNKIIDEEIEKAIIMRDGKPGFLLMDFAKYEEIMAEFEMLKNDISTDKQELIAKKNIEPIEVVPKKVIVSEMQVENRVIKSSQVVPPRPTKEEIIVPAISTDYTEENHIKEKTQDVILQEISEEEEIEKAIKSIHSMNFDDDMKVMAESKIKIKILQARQEREKIAKEQEVENKVDLKEELELQVQIKEENKKKERELKEFWD